MKRDILLFRIACISFGISAFSFLFSFFGDYKGNTIAIAFALANSILFWLGLIAGALVMVVINRHRKAYMKRKKQKSSGGRAGALRFFSNIKAAVADVAMIVFLALTIVLGFMPTVNNGFAMVSLSFFLFAFYMHCVLNGVNYSYIKSLKEERDYE